LSEKEKNPFSRKAKMKNKNAMAINIKYINVDPKFLIRNIDYISF